MEVGPQGAASTPPTSSALVAAPLATENKVEIGNATACAAVVASLVDQLRTPEGMAAFGDLKKVEKALAEKDKTHVLGQLLAAREDATLLAELDDPRHLEEADVAGPERGPDASGLRVALEVAHL